MTAVLRLALALVAAAWAGSAKAEGVPGLDVASLVRDGGPWGMVTVLCAVIGYLWLRLSSKEDEIRDLNKDLITATGRAEKIAGDNTAALQAFDAAAKVRAEKDADKWAAIKQLGEDATKTAVVVTSNASSMSRIEAAMEVVRAAIVELTRELARGRR